MSENISPLATNEKAINLQNLQLFKALMETLIEGYVVDVTDKDNEQDEKIEENKQAIETNAQSIESIFTILDQMSGDEGGSSSDLAQQLADLRKLLDEFSEVEDISDWIGSVNEAIAAINSHIASIGFVDTQTGKFITGISYNTNTHKFTITRGSIAKTDLPTITKDMLPTIAVGDIDYSGITDSAGAATDFTSAVRKVSPPTSFDSLDGVEDTNNGSVTIGADGVVVSRVTEANGIVTAKYKKLTLADLPSGIFNTSYSPWNSALTSLIADVNTAIAGAFNVGGNPNATFKAVYDDVEALKSVINEFTPEGEGALTNAINTIREVYAFLSQYQDNQTLAGILQTLENALKEYADGVAQTKASAAQSAAISAAQTYTDGKIDELDYGGNAAGQGEVISNVTQTNGKINVSKKALAKADIPNIDMSQVNGLQNALANVQDQLVFATDADIRGIFTANTNSMVSLANLEE